MSCSEEILLWSSSQIWPKTLFCSSTKSLTLSRFSFIWRQSVCKVDAAIRSSKHLLVDISLCRWEICFLMLVSSSPKLWNLELLYEKESQLVYHFTMFTYIQLQFKDVAAFSKIMTFSGLSFLHPPSLCSSRRFGTQFMLIFNAFQNFF